MKGKSIGIANRDRLEVVPNFDRVRVRFGGHPAPAFSSRGVCLARVGVFKQRPLALYRESHSQF